MSTKVQMVCGTCGSEDVVRDAWASWDVDRQRWALANVFDEGFCTACETTSNLDEVDLGKWEANVEKGRV